MNEVLAILEQLSVESELTGEQVAAVLEDRGWTVLRRTASASFPRAWQHGELRAGIQGDAPAVRVEFTLWLRKVDEDWGDEGLDSDYDDAVEQMRRLTAEVGANPLSQRLADHQGDATDGLDYIDHTAWQLEKRSFLVGAIQQDTELPVCVVAVIG